MGREALRCGHYSSGEEMKSKLLPQLVTLVVLVGGCAGIRQTASTEFPGRQHSLLSPNGTSVVRNTDADTQEEQIALGDNHALVLEDLRSGQRKMIYPYPRHVTVKWSPNGQRLAITDFDGSDHASCSIFSVADERLINVEAAIMNEFGSYHAELAASHLYFAASSWIDDKLLKVSATGYGLSNGHLFTRNYVYNLSPGEVSA